jgi:hypothetical protein
MPISVHGFQHSRESRQLKSARKLRVFESLIRANQQTTKPKLR